MKRIFNQFAFFSLVFAIIAESNLNAQEKDLVTQAKEDITLFFRFDNALLDTTYMSNQEHLLKLKKLMQDHRVLAGIDSLTIASYASPEGNPLYNDQLAAKRAEAIKEYMLFSFPDVGKYHLQTRSLGENWTGLKEMILKDPNLPGRSQVLMILDKPIGSLEKEEQIKAVMDGAAWRYIERNMLRYLRGASCVMFFLDPVKMAAADTVAVQDVLPVIDEQLVLNSDPPVPLTITEPAYRQVRPIAFKTNLLFDAATALNVEVEVPVAKRFSIAGEWMFPWWLWEDKQNCLEVLSGNLEARYWFRPNFAKQDPSLGLHNPLTGWFIGLYGGGGKYDLEWKREGYQGEFFIATGVSGGYVLPLNRNISMEFSLGLGILRTKYRHYHAQYCELKDHWHLVKQYSGRYTWIGPTKAKISFIWYPHFKMKKKGGNL